MGLDMYLNGHVHVGYNDEVVADKIAAFFPEIKTGVKTIVVEAAYWRKANAIHGWFVKNIQSNVDDCGAYWVSREELKKLVDTCKEVLNNKDRALELLSPTPGYFFGDAAVDDWYFEGIKLTIEQIETCLAWPDYWSFQYQSSW
jgi:hypothetical protein